MISNSNLWPLVNSLDADAAGWELLTSSNISGEPLVNSQMIEPGAEF